MKNIILKFIIAFLIIDFAHARPVMNNNSDFKSSQIESRGLSFHQKSIIESSINKMHGLFKRSPITLGSKSSSKTGFAAMTTSESQNERKKKRTCLKWTKEPITNRHICVKFNVVPKNEKEFKSKLPEIRTKLPVISTKLPVIGTKLPESSTKLPEHSTKDFPKLVQNPHGIKTMSSVSIIDVS